MNNKLRNKYTIIVAALAIMFSATSCEDFFDQKAGNKINPDDHYKSTVDLEISVGGVLTPLKEAMPKLILTDGLLSDQMLTTPNADGYMQEINEHIYSIDNPYLNGSDLYKVIINANEVLENLYKIGEIDPSFDEYYVNSFTNSLIGIRSWAYFTLVKLYGETAWIEGNMSSLPKDGLVYIPKAAMLDTLINQLLPYLHLDESTAELRVSGYVNTKALIGEIYLEKNDYANAAHFLKLGLESYGDAKTTFKLDKTHSKEVWGSIFLNAENNTTENIAVIPFKGTEGQINPVTEWTISQYVIKPSPAIMNMFMYQYPVKGPMGDVNRGVGISLDTIATGESFISKYALDGGDPYGADIIISRAADLHLLLAEALNRMGDYTTAMILLNDGFSRIPAASIPIDYRRWNTGLGVRGRVTLMPHTIPAEMTDPGQIMEHVENLIIDERAMELAFEGKRYFDLMRIARRRGNNDYLAGKVASKFTDAAQRQRIQEYLWNENNWYVPLNK